MKEAMKCVVFQGPGRYAIEERPVPAISKENEVLAKVLAASICGTDVHILHDPPGVAAVPGIILGHECVAEVVSCGSGAGNLQAGDRIILDNNIPCGTCPACQSGKSNLCGHMSSMGVHTDGVFAEYIVFPEQNAVKIRDEVPALEGIFAEPLNCVMGAVKKLKVMPGDTVLVLGGGPIGQYFSSLMKLSGAGKVLMSEISAYRAGFAAGNGVCRVIHPGEEDLLAEVLKETGGMGADIVIDAVGVLLPDAIRTARNGGQILLFGMNAAARQEISQNDIVAKGLTVFGNFIGNGTLGSVGRMLDTGMVSFKNLVTHELPLERFGEGLEAMKRGEAMEVVLYPGQ